MADTNIFMTKTSGKNVPDISANFGIMGGLWSRGQKVKTKKLRIQRTQA